ncbi:Uncharacterised protein [Nocardia brasiliensis]|nr:Uncharacterised protein [Nocardia brasiliensis]
MPYFAEIETSTRRPATALNGWHSVNLVGRLD